MRALSHGILVVNRFFFNISEVNTSYTEQGHVAEITNLVMNQISQTTLRVFVGVIGTENRVRHLNPILAIFLDLNAAVFHLRQKRLAVNTTNSTVTPELAESHSYCRLQPWTFSFSSVQWYPRFIIQPESYRANRCVGECPPTLIDRYFNITSHGTIKSFAGIRLCCVPIEYKAQSIMFFKVVIIIKRFNRLTVSRCGCR